MRQDSDVPTVWCDRERKILRVLGCSKLREIRVSRPENLLWACWSDQGKYMHGLFDTDLIGMSMGEGEETCMAS